MTKKLLSMLVFACFFAASMSAQERRNADPVRPRTILTVEAFLTSIGGNVTQRTGDSEAVRVKSLISDSKPAVYVLSDGTHLYGENPVCLYTDVRSMNHISANDPQLPAGNIEMVSIRINNAEELSSGIDLSVFSDFPKVKYIYIQSNINASAESISRALNHDHPKYSVFYKMLQNN